MDVWRISEHILSLNINYFSYDAKVRLHLDRIMWIHTITLLKEICSLFMLLLLILVLWGQLLLSLNSAFRLFTLLSVLLKTMHTKKVEMWFRKERMRFEWDSLLFKWIILSMSDSGKITSLWKGKMSQKVWTLTEIIKYPVQCLTVNRHSVNLRLSTPAIEFTYLFPIHSHLLLGEIEKYMQLSYFPSPPPEYDDAHLENI